MKPAPPVTRTRERFAMRAPFSIEMMCVAYQFMPGRGYLARNVRLLADGLIRHPVLPVPVRSRYLDAPRVSW
jgi:hypothetical protein